MFIKINLVANKSYFSNSGLIKSVKEVNNFEVRPLPIHERISSSSVGGGSRSPSLAGSNRCRIRRIAESGSIKNCESDRCIASCDEIEPVC